MDTADLTDIPISLGIRQYLDDISYGNPLPEWFEVVDIDYKRRHSRIGARILNLAEQTKSTCPHISIEAPKKAGGTNRWVIPSINDQMALHTCVLAEAQALEASLDQRVFSYRLNKETTKVHFLENPVSAWTRFKTRTSEKCAENSCILQFDLKDAYGHIGCANVAEHLKRACGDTIPIRFIESALTALTKNGSLPFVNDSLFFIGNWYLSQVDNIVAGVSEDFIRFVDDYKVFGQDITQLESALKQIRRELRKNGFEINDKKVFLGSCEHYLDIAAQSKYTVETGSGYAARPPAASEAFDSSALLDRVRLIVDKHDNFLNQGFGRLAMASLRRMRAWSAFTMRNGFIDNPHQQFSSQLSADHDLLAKIGKLMTTLTKEPQETWRLVWLIHLTQSLDSRQKMGTTTLEAIYSSIRLLKPINPIAAAWASIDRSPSKYSMNVEFHHDTIEDLHELGYLERGLARNGA